MSKEDDNFIQSGSIVAESGIDQEGDHAWRYAVTDISSMEALGLCLTILSQLLIQQLQNMRTIEGDDDAG